MKLYLHIGTEKTGTTSIQKFLSNNKKLFNKKILPIETFRLNENTMNSRILPYLFENNEDKSINKELLKDNDKNGSLSLYIEKIKHEIRNNNSELNEYLISSEHLSSRLLDLNQINTLKIFLNKVFDKIKIIIYVREQSSMAQSAYFTSVFNGYNEPFNDYILNHVNLANKYFNFDLMIKMWEEIFGKENIILKIYDDKYYNDLIEDFFMNFNIKLTIPKNLKKENQSLNYFQTELLKNIIKQKNINEKFLNLKVNDWDFNKKILQKIKNNNILSGNFPFPMYKNKIYELFDGANKDLFSKYYFKYKNFFTKPKETILDESISIENLIKQSFLDSSYLASYEWCNNFENQSLDYYK